METSWRKTGSRIVGGAILAGCLLAVADVGVAGTTAGARGDDSRREAARSNAGRTLRHHGSGSPLLAQWSQRWSRWFVSIPLNVNPIKDTAGTQCGVNQEGPVWFINGPGGTNTLQCTIPFGKALFGPVAGYLNDYPCPEPEPPLPPFQPAPGQTIEDFLSEGAQQIVDEFVTGAEATLDGEPLQLFRVSSGLFSFTAAADLQGIDACVTGSPQLGVTDGYFFFVQGLPPGDHTLRIRSVFGGAPTDNIFHLKVVR